MKVKVSEKAPAAREVLGRVAVGELHDDERPRGVVAPISGGTRVLAGVLADLEADDIEVTEVVLRRPTLDDVFLALTGHATKPEEDRSKAATARKRG